jgi:hypothetical protein
MNHSRLNVEIGEIDKHEWLVDTSTRLWMKKRLEGIFDDESSKKGAAILNLVAVL